MTLKYTPLGWSKFRRGVLVVEVTIGIISKRLNQVPKSGRYLDRQDLIMSLVDEGYSYASIANQLNDMGLEKPQGGRYEAHSINMSVYQWRKRAGRAKEHSFSLKGIRVKKGY